MHVDLIGPYIKSIRQQQPYGTVIQNNYSLTCTTMIKPDTGWFDIIKIPMFDLEVVALVNHEYIDKSYSRFSQMFHNTWLCRYLSPRKVVFDNDSDFKQYSIHLLKDFDVKIVSTSVKNPQSNAQVEQVHQVILNMLVTKDLHNKVFDYISPWGETIEYIAWSIRASYYCAIMATPVQVVFDRDMLFNLASVIDWRVNMHDDD